MKPDQNQKKTTMLPCSRGWGFVMPRGSQATTQGNGLSVATRAPHAKDVDVAKCRQPAPSSARDACMKANGNAASRVGSSLAEEKSDTFQRYTSGHIRCCPPRPSCALSLTQAMADDKNRKITPEELQQHATAKDCWFVIDGIVYDVTKYQDTHPGGNAVMVEHAGKDCTSNFEDIGTATPRRLPHFIPAVHLGDNCSPAP